jgi:hypothetical protein
MNRRALTVITTAALVTGLVAGCAGDGDDGESAPATSSTTTSSAPPPGCPPVEGETPPGSPTKQIVDVDGDGRRDIAYFRGGAERLVFGIRTASGGFAEVPFTSASPVARRVLVVDADERPPAEIILSDGRSASLFAFVDCAIQPVLDPEGELYVFDSGFAGTGTGVGCIDVDEDGRRELVGLNETTSDDAGVTWTRTVVELDGLNARNGATDQGTFRRPEDQASIDLLHRITCGDLTIDNDALVLPA